MANAGTLIECGSRDGGRNKHEELQSETIDKNGSGKREFNVAGNDN